MNTRDSDFFDQALACLLAKAPQDKIALTRRLYTHWMQRRPDTHHRGVAQRIEVPGRPDRPGLVHPAQVPRRSFNTQPGRLCLVHAIAHIEFNAINLALDAAYRFRDMPQRYYSDWLKVAVEEAEHFILLDNYLAAHGSGYGRYSAHNGLWEMALKTDHDVMVRMALVPRVLEARGLDVTPGMIKKCRSVGDHELVNILEIIYRDEIGHVNIGSYWFSYVCRQRKLEPEATFSALLDRYMQDTSFADMNEQARLKAGFSHNEILDLAGRKNIKHA